MKPLHYMERLARDLEDEWLKGLLDEHERDLAGREPKADRRTASHTPVHRVKPTRVSRGPVQPEAVSRPAKPLDCHAGKRAPRYVKSMADLAAHPELFRCSTCGALLDAPKNASPLRGRRWGAVGERVLGLLAADIHRFGEIARAAELTNPHAYNELSRLIKYGMVERYGRGLYRLTPKYQPALAATPRGRQQGPEGD